MSSKLKRKLKNLPIDQNNSIFLASPVVRSFGKINWRGFWTLYLAEVKRFIKMRTQALIAPIITTLLFFFIFTLALDGTKEILGDLSFSVFFSPWAYNDVYYTELFCQHLIINIGVQSSR